MSAKVNPPDDDVLWARELSCAHDGSPALTAVSLGVRTGEILAVTGPRGGGKTTLLKCLSGQLPPESGEVWFNSVPLHTLSAAARDRLRRERFGWVGSTPELVPELTGWENVALPLLLAGVSNRDARRTATEWLERLDVGDCAKDRPASLLQSQRQRIAIARALAHEPTVLFADEPTAPLHRQDRAQALRTLTTAARSHGITVLLATHEPAALPHPTVPEPAATRAAPPGSPEHPDVPLADRTVTLVDGRRAISRAAQPADQQETEPCSLSV